MRVRVHFCIFLNLSDATCILQPPIFVSYSNLFTGMSYWILSIVYTFRLENHIGMHGLFLKHVHFLQTA